MGTGCGSGGGGNEATGNNNNGNNNDGGGNTSTGSGGGRAPVGNEKAGYLGKLVDNTTGLGISGATFSIAGQQAVTNTQGIFNLEMPNGSGEVEAILTVFRYQNYLKNASIRSLNTNGGSVVGCTNNKKFFVPAVAKGQVWDMGAFTLYPDNPDVAPAGPCGF
jgi:hypothetical protein